jgi:hypothetical protein
MAASDGRACVKARRQIAIVVVLQAYSYVHRRHHYPRSSAFILHSQHPGQLVHPHPHHHDRHHTRARYRAALGRQENRGRSKKITESLKTQSQVKADTGSKAVSNLLSVAVMLLGTLAVLYALIWYSMQQEA